MRPTDRPTVEVPSAATIAQAWPNLLTTARSLTATDPDDVAATVAARLLDATDVDNARLNAARRILAAGDQSNYGLAWRSIRYVAAEHIRAERRRAARLVRIGSADPEHVTPWGDDWHRGRADENARAAAIAADGRVMRADRETNYSREYIAAATVAGRVLDATESARTHRRQLAAHPYESERSTERAVVLIREASLESMLARTMRLRGHHANDEDPAEDRRLRAAWWSTFADRPAPILRGERPARLARLVDATGHPFGRLIAAHYVVTTPRERSGQPSTREHGAIDWTALLRRIGVDEPTSADRRDIQRMARYAAAYAVDMVRRGRIGRPTSGPTSGPTDKVPAWRAATAGGMVPTSVDVPSPERAAAR